MVTEVINITKTKYAGNFIYEKIGTVADVLKFFNTAEGYVDPVNPSDYSLGFNYVYQYKDHLGNIRLSYKDTDNNGIIATSEIIEENNYYPFGLKHKGYNTAINGTHHKYMFGGKEFDESFQTLNTYDFGARNYDPALGRWMNIDPLSEQMRRHSPYNYAFNNPIYFIDPDGMAPTEGGGPGDELIKKANEGLNNIVSKLFKLVSSMGDSQPKSPSNDEKQKNGSGSPVIDALGDFNKAVEKNAGDVGIGMAYVAAEGMDKGGEKVSDTANTITLASGGTSGEATVPIALIGGITSVVGKGIKGIILKTVVNDDKGAKEEFKGAAIGGITIYGGLQMGKALSTKGVVSNKTESNILSATWDFITKPFTSDKK